MDDLVVQAMKKWPHVPDCYGWLALDARGDWYMRDDRIQRQGPFPRVKGSRILHDKLRGFIERNYVSDPDGRWYFQNGPQRVFVELEAAPWVWRLQDAPGGPPQITSHTGVPARFGGAWLDEAGRLFLQTDLGFGIVHTADMGLAADAVLAAQWVPFDAPFDAFEQRFGYRLRPAASVAPAAP